MRGLIVGLGFLLGGEALADAPAPPHDAGTARVLDVDRKTLSAEEVERYVAPYFPAIRTCYLTHAKPARNATATWRALSTYSTGPCRVYCKATDCVDAPFTRTESRTVVKGTNVPPYRYALFVLLRAYTYKSSESMPKMVSPHAPC